MFRFRRRRETATIGATFHMDASIARRLASSPLSRKTSVKIVGGVQSQVLPDTWYTVAKDILVARSSHSHGHALLSDDRARRLIRFQNTYLPRATFQLDACLCLSRAPPSLFHR